ncbi:hypothetical protein ADL22_30305 [Streptomyces sp. NRRL F-4489]|uniref:DUF6153 family protein n=1 Tax=Streptomyces sp. NRRL F-4489 TaxID=1609095 RepID=UPI00074AFF87|nr:DUF6153 family protein [Streptomyces sp. NRRL F-4489]KUL34354.1 hypothetical protein ADL22_30305 [Streptomyces sp. NRRL F-4489]
MRANRRIRAAGAWGHLLLIAVLALGVFAMHTLGHPSGDREMTAGPGAGVVAGAGAAAYDGGAYDDTAYGNAAHAMAAMSPMDRPAAHHTSHTTHAHHTSGPSSHHSPGAGMDMTSLCVAVLGGWALACLLRLVVRRRADWLVLLRASALAVLRPNPPPRPPDLAQLSILRI